MRKPHPGSGEWLDHHLRSKASLGAQDSFHHTAPGTPNWRRSKQAGKEKDKKSEGVRKKEERERERGSEGSKTVRME